MTLAVEARTLTRRFGKFVAVDSIDLAVPEGRIFGYLGLNGAGKTTTIRMLTTLLPPTSGTASVGGHDVVAEPLEVRKLIGYVGDDMGDAKPSWTAREYLGYFAALRPERPDVERSLGAVGLDPAWRGKPMGQYSTGMRRRVEVARALLGRPKVLFLDEPTRGLDLPAKRQMWDLLRRQAAEEKATIFVSSHEVTEIRALCHEIAVLSRGKIVYAGPTAELAPDAEGFEERLIKLLES